MYRSRDTSSVYIACELVDVPKRFDFSRNRVPKENRTHSIFENDRAAYGKKRLKRVLTSSRAGEIVENRLSGKKIALSNTGDKVRIMKPLVRGVASR